MINFLHYPTAQAMQQINWFYFYCATIYISTLANFTVTCHCEICNGVNKKQNSDIVNTILTKLRALHKTHSNISHPGTKLALFQ